MYRDAAIERGMMIINHHANRQRLHENDPATSQTYVPNGVHPVAAGLRQVVMPLLKWKLSARKS